MSLRSCFDNLQRSGEIKPCGCNDPDCTTFQLSESAVLEMDRRRLELLATSITEKPRSVTCFTASLRNSSVYCLLLPINTSMVAMNYGARVSTKDWPVHLMS